MRVASDTRPAFLVNLKCLQRNLLEYHLLIHRTPGIICLLQNVLRTNCAIHLIYIIVRRDVIFSANAR